LALVLPALMLMFVVAADFARVFFTYIGVENAAREGASYGSMNIRCTSAATAGCADPENVVYHVRQEMGGDTTAVVTTSCSPTCTATWAGLGNRVSVTVTKPFTFITPLVSNVLGSTFQLRATATALVLQ
jgi:hypothetical protein